MAPTKGRVEHDASTERAELAEHAAALVKFLGGDQERDWAALVPGADTAWSAAADVRIQSRASPASLSLKPARATSRADAASALADNGTLDPTSPLVNIYSAGFLETGKLFKANVPVLALPEPAHHTRMWVGQEGPFASSLSKRLFSR